ncbi:universal stress protein [Streptomyces sp. ACA25]|uniref:universal stress protein n=1 Tax=Streptomyces sp. ACA25 TaxID=3022596 RepID=UPI0023071E73|nr:universal stress protein [Streptomyces sp. ACA25]MDB1087730.1 universal stress protein [Streptomyces sp. ACA25]
MSTALLVAVIVVLWVSIGVAAVVFFLGRKGYRDWHWYLIGGILGLIFVPIAAERARNDVRVLERTPVAEHVRNGGERITILVGTDGSPEGDQAVRDAARLAVSSAHRVVLATVVDAEAKRAEENTAAARSMLIERVAWLVGDSPEGGPDTVIEIGSGQPSTVLLGLAESEEADLIVIGRRGKGLSQRVLGSVADEVTKRFPRPVLLSSITAERR